MTGGSDQPRPTPARSTNGGQRAEAELRAFASAYFSLSGAVAIFATVLQLAAVALAAAEALRVALMPFTPWVLLTLAALGPYSRNAADRLKLQAEAILRRLELSDGFSESITQLQAEELKESASFLVAAVARRQVLELRPFASDALVGPRRLVENTAESSWWSKILAAELSKWQSSWAGILMLACVSALYSFATHPNADASHSSDASELAAALLVFVFVEGSVRRGRELREFAIRAGEISDRAERLLAGPGPTERESVLLATDYYLARQNAPRISSVWHSVRKARLNAAWTRARNQSVR